MRRLLQRIFKKQIEGVEHLKVAVERRAKQGIDTYTTGWQRFLMSLID